MSHRWRAPADCFETALEAVRIAVPTTSADLVLRHRQRLGAMANPDVNALPPIKHTFAKPGEPFQPYARDRKLLARQFAIPP